MNKISCYSKVMYSYVQHGFMYVQGVQSYTYTLVLLLKDGAGSALCYI